MAIPRIQVSSGWNDEVQPEPSNIQFFHWSNTEYDWGVKNDWADQRLDPVREAQNTVNLWESRYHSGAKSLFFWKPVAVPLDGVWYNRTAMGFSLYEGAKNYGRYELVLPWYEAYYAELARLGHEPDNIVLDDEGSHVYGPSMETLEEDIAQCLADDDVRKLMPDEILAHEAHYLATNNTGRSMMGFWGKTIDVRIYKKIFVEPYRAVFGRDPFFHNYGNAKPSFATRGWNGRLTDPMWDTSITNGTSSPVMYLLQDRLQNPQWYFDVERHPRWVRFFLALNKVRSNLNSGDVVPWVSTAGYTYLHDKIRMSDPWLDCEVVRHCILMGVTKFNHWNPGQDSNQWLDSWRHISDDAYVEAIDSVKDRPKAKGPFVEIDWNADYIETAGYRTTYDEFLERGYYQAPGSVYS